MPEYPERNRRLPLHRHRRQHQALGELTSRRCTAGSRTPFRAPRRSRRGPRRRPLQDHRRRHPGRLPDGSAGHRRRDRGPDRAAAGGLGRARSAARADGDSCRRSDASRRRLPRPRAQSSCSRCLGPATGSRSSSRIPRATLATTLPIGYALQDLGRHHLQDLLEAERIFQLCGPGLPAEFPPLKSLDQQPNNLPAQPTPLIGREHELAALRAMLTAPDTRLVTLIGPGGTGKTRLALQVAAEMLETLPRWGLVGAAGRRIGPGPGAAGDRRCARRAGESRRAAADDVGRASQAPADTLLLLDNVEHLLAAAPQIRPLLEAAPRLVILATSREPLRLRAEREFPVPPLPLPDATSAASRPRQRSLLRQSGSLSSAPRRSNPPFVWMRTTSPTWSRSASRLDGLPLAIELAASRVRLLSPGRAPGPARSAPGHPHRRRDATSRRDSRRCAPPSPGATICSPARSGRSSRVSGVFAGGCSIRGRGGGL